MLRENIGARLKKISPAAGSVDGAKCAFAPGGALGFIDTSSARDGSRGIAFFSDRMFVNTEGTARETAYKSIRGIQIISSFEDSFADELSIAGEGFELRLSDYSLDKFELKRLLEELCREREQLAEKHAEQAEKYAEIIAQKLAEDAAAHVDTAESVPEKEPEPDWLDEAVLPTESGHPFIEETRVEIPETRSSLPEGYAPAPIPEEKIDWISGGAPRSASAEMSAQPPEKPRPKPPEIMNGVVDRAPIIGAAGSSDNGKKDAPAAPKKEEALPKKEEEPPKPELTESEMREQIENMPREEMLRFLSDTLSEINAPLSEQTEPTEREEQQIEERAGVPQTVPAAPEQETPELESAPAASEAPPSKWEKLTEEPIWGDIYIKASKNLRELCESGKLTMEQMEAELKEHLLGAAEAFERITDNENKVPKMMFPKITELKAAAENFDQYFNYGEDIAIRAMFFMLYQMLTYADRIAETPETKDRLNDFFRRFGPAGITLSMLDMRV